MRIYPEETPPVEGQLRINFDKFPKELLDKMFANPGYAPVLRIEIPRMYFNSAEGIALESKLGGSSVIEFDFIATDIEIRQAD